MMPRNCATHVDLSRTETTVLPPSTKYTHQGNSAHGTMEHIFKRTSQIIISEYIHAYYR